MAIAKEVYDRLNLLEYKGIVQSNKNNENEINGETENLHNNEGENHIIKKIKGFLDKIF